MRENPEVLEKDIAYFHEAAMELPAGGILPGEYGAAIKSFGTVILKQEIKTQSSRPEGLLLSRIRGKKGKQLQLK